MNNCAWVSAEVGLKDLIWDRIYPQISKMFFKASALWADEENVQAEPLAEKRCQRLSATHFVQGRN